MQVHFVDAIPKADAIQDGHLYISLKYNMTSHRCASGCGQLVPLPLSPADWSLSYNGETVSLSPSIGNGVLNCHSHYFIKNNKVVWASDMSLFQARQQQAQDTDLLKRHLDERARQHKHPSILKCMAEWVHDLFNRK